MARETKPELTLDPTANEEQRSLSALFLDVVDYHPDVVAAEMSRHRTVSNLTAAAQEDTPYAQIEWGQGLEALVEEHPFASLVLSVTAELLDNEVDFLLTPDDNTKKAIERQKDPDQTGRIAKLGIFASQMSKFIESQEVTTPYQEPIMEHPHLYPYAA